MCKLNHCIVLYGFSNLSSGEQYHGSYCQRLDYELSTSCNLAPVDEMMYVGLLLFIAKISQKNAPIARQF